MNNKIIIATFFALLVFSGAHAMDKNNQDTPQRHADLLPPQHRFITVAQINPRVIQEWKKRKENKENQKSPAQKK